MSNVLMIQPRRVDFRTQANAGWYDGLPIIGRAFSAGVVPGANVGNGTVAINSVAVGTRLGAHLLRVTGLVLGIAQFTVTNPKGGVTAIGAAGVAALAGGINLTLTAGLTPFAIGDTFAISVLPQPIDITGIRFDLQVRRTPKDPEIALEATSAPASGSPTIVAGTTGGNVAMKLSAAAMSELLPGSYVYDIRATDPVTKEVVVAFYGKITHEAGVGLLAA